MHNNVAPITASGRSCAFRLVLRMVMVVVVVVVVPFAGHGNHIVRLRVFELAQGRTSTRCQSHGLWR